MHYKSKCKPLQHNTLTMNEKKGSPLFQSAQVIKLRVVIFLKLSIYLAKLDFVFLENVNLIISYACQG